MYVSVLADERAKYCPYSLNAGRFSSAVYGLVSFMNVEYAYVSQCVRRLDFLQLSCDVCSSLLLWNSAYRISLFFPTLCTLLIMTVISLVHVLFLGKNSRNTER